MKRSCRYTRFTVLNAVSQVCDSYVGEAFGRLGLGDTTADGSIVDLLKEVRNLDFLIELAIVGCHSHTHYTHFTQYFLRHRKCE